MERKLKEMQTAVLSREEKGRMIAEKPNQIMRVDERFYKVASQNGRGMYDVVQRENGSWTCNCLDFHYRALEQHQIVRCKHIIAVQVSLELRKKARENTVIQPITISSCVACGSSHLKRFGILTARLTFTKHISKSSAHKD
jgi:hypothetical protein